MGDEVERKRNLFLSTQLQRNYIDWVITSIKELLKFLNDWCKKFALKFDLIQMDMYNSNIVTEKLISNYLEDEEPKREIKVKSDKVFEISSFYDNVICDLTDNRSDYDLLSEYHQENKILEVNYYPKFSEYYFLGDFGNILPLTNIGTIKQQKVAEEAILDSLNVNGLTEGRIRVEAIDDISSLMNDNTIHAYYACGTVSILCQQNKSLDIPENSQKLFFPQWDNGHYYLIVANMINETIYYYDSMESEERKTISFDNVKRILKLAGLNITWAFISAKSPQQTNLLDCGIYTIINMSHRDTANGDGTLLYEYDDEVYRDRIARCLKQRVKLLVDY